MTKRKKNTMDICKTFTFEASHFLPYVPRDHKCGRLHGHSFTIEIYVSGPIDKKMGWVVDYADISQAFHACVDRLDHRHLNDIPGLENPTSENIARWIWIAAKPELRRLSKVIVRETRTSCAVYTGE